MIKVEPNQKLVNERDDVPFFFADSFEVQRPKAVFTEYHNTFKQGFLDIDFGPSNSNSYPIEDSYAPYLELV